MSDENGMVTFSWNGMLSRATTNGRSGVAFVLNLPANLVHGELNRANLTRLKEEAFEGNGKLHDDLPDLIVSLPEGKSLSEFLEGVGAEILPG